MGHKLFVGMSESGKTTLAQEMAKVYAASETPVGVLDITMDEGWTGYLTDKQEEFLKWYWNSRGCAAFIDEAGETLDKFDKAMISTATRGRKWGHINHYITQRGNQLSPVIRGQCSEIFLFNSDPDVCEIYSREFATPQLKDGWRLARGEFMHVKRFGEDGQRFFERGKLQLY